MKKYDKLVIVCWNALEYTKNTLNSLLKSIDDSFINSVQLTLINNGSSDGTLQYLEHFTKKSFLKVTLINNKVNIGIGGAYNQGLKESIDAGCKYTVFCNNDLLFTDNWLPQMTSVMENNSNIALLGPIVPSSTSFFDENTTIKSKLLKVRNGLNIKEEFAEFIEPFKNFQEFKKSITQINNEKYKTNLRLVKFPNAISSCIVMGRTQIFKSIGYFANPEFKEYGGEDIDMCWRVVDDGYDVAVTNDVYIHHYRGKSIKVAKFNRAELLKKSNVKLFEIWKTKIIGYYKNRGVNKVSDIDNSPDNWLINEIKYDVNLEEEILR